jgi:hypothetical protein
MIAPEMAALHFELDRFKVPLQDLCLVHSQVDSEGRSTPGRPAPPALHFEVDRFKVPLQDLYRVHSQVDSEGRSAPGPRMCWRRRLS